MSHLILAVTQTALYPHQAPRSPDYEIALRRIADAGCERTGPEQIYCYHWGSDDLCWPCYAHQVLQGEPATRPGSSSFDFEERWIASGA